MKRFLICLSGVNLLFFPVWNALLGKTWYYDVSDISYSPILLVVCVGWVLFFGTFFYCIDLFINRSQREGRLHKFVSRLLLIFIPFIPMTMLPALYLFASIHFYTNEGPVPYLEVKENQPKIAFLLFDELDIRAVFEKRPSDLKLENLDAFKAQSFFAAKAYAAGPATRISIPALLTGLPLANIQFTAHDQAELTLADNQKKVILNKNSSSLFSQARSLGYNCGIKGSYHSYYKLFGPALSQCDTLPHYSYSFYDGSVYLFKRVITKILQIFNLSLTSVSPQLLAMSQESGSKRLEPNQEAIHKQLIDYWLPLLLNKELNLTFVHFPYPHPPSQYDYKKERFCHPDEGNYLGNVKMVDITLADIREEMLKASLWNETTIIITSDHWLRKYWPSCGYNFSEDELKFVTSIDHRVPFMIKFAGQKDPIVYPEPFNSVLVHDIILEIIQGKIKTAEQLVTWLEQNKEKVPLEVAEE